MSENPVPETLETIAAKIDALGRSMAERFDAVDQRFVETDGRITKVEGRFDMQLVEMKAQLGVKIEAVDTKVTQVYDEVIAMRDEAKRNAAEQSARL